MKFLNKSTAVLIGLMFMGLVADAQNLNQKLAAVFNGNTKEILVAAHRGD